MAMNIILRIALVFIFLLLYLGRLALNMTLVFHYTEVVNMLSDFYHFDESIKPISELQQ